MTKTIETNRNGTRHLEINSLTRKAEEAVLGSLLRDNGVIAEVAAILNGENFYQYHHRLIFDSVLSLHAQGEPADLVTLANILHQRNQIADIGSYAYLGELLEAAPTAANAIHYARIVKDHAFKRSIQHEFNEIQNLAKNPTGPPDEMLSKAQQKLGELDQKFVSCTYREGSARNEFPIPIPASALMARDLESNWLWHGYLAYGSVTMLSALWKAGKTTLLGHLVREMREGGHLCGLEVKRAKVLIVSEEPDGLWMDRRDRLCLGDHALFVLRPFITKPTLKEWERFVNYLEREAKEKEIGLIVLDTLAGCWPVVNENDAGEVQTAIMPIRQLTNIGASVLLVHHLRKGDGEEGTASRGSGALAGFVDTILELRRFNPKNRSDRRRVLSAFGRYSATIGELVIELSDDGLNYAPQGDRKEASHIDREKIIGDLLPTELPGFTVEEILANWPIEPKPGERTLREDLSRGVAAGRWKQ
ncbi:MAG TPA: DnaB-like helicase N-terminal domain-containing protein [Gemmataceae bacterium]|jgi:hypothetical protein|nr:DnaB-like helicase N-terminal domain-containing protein [Gemmataceae bacterium]